MWSVYYRCIYHQCACVVMWPAYYKCTTNVLWAYTHVRQKSVLCYRSCSDVRVWQAGLPFPEFVLPDVTCSQYLESCMLKWHERHCVQQIAPIHTSYIHVFHPRPLFQTSDEFPGRANRDTQCSYMYIATEQTYCTLTWLWTLRLWEKMSAVWPYNSEVAMRRLASEEPSFYTTIEPDNEILLWKRSPVQCLQTLHTIWQLDNEMWYKQDL